MRSRFLPASCDRSAVGSPHERRPIRSFVHRSPHLDLMRAKVSSGRHVPFDPTRRRGQPQRAAGHGGLHAAACGRHKGSSVHTDLISRAVWDEPQFQPLWFAVNTFHGNI